MGSNFVILTILVSATVLQVAWHVVLESWSRRCSIVLSAKAPKHQIPRWMPVDYRMYLEQLGKNIKT